MSKQENENHQHHPQEGHVHSEDNHGHHDHESHDGHWHYDHGDMVEDFKRRFFISFIILAIPLAAGILAPLGIILSPAVGAVLMSLSTIIVAINARLLKA